MSVSVTVKGSHIVGVDPICGMVLIVRPAASQTVLDPFYGDERTLQAAEYEAALLDVQERYGALQPDEIDLPLPETLSDGRDVDVLYLEQGGIVSLPSIEDLAEAYRQLRAALEAARSST